jgi:squalene cyclase
MRVVILAALILAPSALSAPTPERKDEVKMPDSARKATARALAWLAKAQSSDGSWGDSRYPHNTAITSFVLLAFLSQGHVPDRGPYGKEVGKGMRFLLSCAREDGYLIGTRGGNMYNHGMATLALAELWGVSHDKAIKPALKKAVDVIVNSQNREGGWRYSPRPLDADLSVTIMQVMALRAAKNAGLHVKDEVMKKAISYVKRCYNERSGGFTYQPGSTPGFARTAAGLCILHLTGEYKAAEMPRAVQYLKDHFNDRTHFWYGHYYASHAMHQVGGDEWKAWYARMLKEFLPMQKEDGSWGAIDHHSPGPVYQTAIAVISLSVPMNYLPIYQR